MSLCFTLKTLCDICFYLAFANILAGWAGGGETAIFSLPFFALSAYTGAKFDESMSRAKKENHFLRFLPLLILIPAFAITFTLGFWPDMLILFPPAIYLVYIIKSKEFMTVHYDHAGVFYLFFKCYTPLFLALVLFGQRDLAQRASFFYALLFALCSVALMRSLRHDPDILAQKRFQLINFFSIALALTAGILASSPAFLKLCLGILGTVYSTVIAPIITLLALAFVLVLWPVFALLNREGGSMEAIEWPEIEIFLGFGEEEAELITTGATTRVDITAILTAIIIIAAGIIAFFIFRRLLAKSSMGNPAGQAKSGYTAASPQKTKEPAPMGRPLRQVRKLYRNFMLFCKKDGVAFFPAITSQDIERQAAKHFKNPEASSCIRNIYIKARYGGEDAGKEEIKEMKAHISALKKNRALK